MTGGGGGGSLVFFAPKGRAERISDCLNGLKQEMPGVEILECLDDRWPHGLGLVRETPLPEGGSTTPSVPPVAAVPSSRRPGVRPQAPVLQTEAGQGLSVASLIVGSSPAIREVQRRVEDIAKTPLGILILGESGTGKGAVAKAIHCTSDRRDHLFGLIRLKRTWGRKVGNPRGAFSEQRGET